MEDERFPKIGKQGVMMNDDERDEFHTATQLPGEKFSAEIPEKQELIIKSEANAETDSKEISEIYRANSIDLIHENKVSSMKSHLKNNCSEFSVLENTCISDASKDLFPSFRDESQNFQNTLNFINTDSGFISNVDDSSLQCSTAIYNTDSFSIDFDNRELKSSSFDQKKKETFSESDNESLMKSSLDPNSLTISSLLKYSLRRSRPLFPEITISREPVLDENESTFISESKNSENIINDYAMLNEVNKICVVSENNNIKNRQKLSNSDCGETKNKTESNSVDFSASKLSSMKNDQPLKSYEKTNQSKAVTEKQCVIIKTISDENYEKDVKIKPRLSTLIEALDVMSIVQKPVQKNQNSLEALDLQGNLQSKNENCLNEKSCIMKNVPCINRPIHHEKRRDSIKLNYHKIENREHSKHQKPHSENTYFLRSRTRNEIGKFCNECGNFVQDVKMKLSNYCQKCVRKQDENKNPKIPILNNRESRNKNKAGRGPCNSEKKRQGSRIPVSNISRLPLTPHQTQEPFKQILPLRKSRRCQNVTSTIAKNLAENPPPPLIQTVHPKRELRMRTPLTESNRLNEETKENKVNTPKSLKNCSLLPSVHYTKNLTNLKQREWDRLTQKHTVENSKVKMQYFPSLFRPTIIRHKGNKSLQWAQHLTTDKSLNSSPSRTSTLTAKPILVKHDKHDIIYPENMPVNINESIITEHSTNDPSCYKDIPTSITCTTSLEEVHVHYTNTLCSK
ncbi:putative leucine-rich repeat-containing protein DDB_G0290503 [Centruroides vittatus]|uniref:putative leucine-rich repeat-containing protein DDB_G0290503 n=1 Tax=Centruroides vittatus TaxID=120091 RepID=UPI00351086C4